MSTQRSQRTITLIACLSSAALIGCSFEAAVTQVAMSGIEDGPGGSSSVGGMNIAGQEPPPGATQPPVGGVGGDPGDGRCTPGDNIPEALCTICGPDARYLMPTSDPDCPAVDCGELNTFYTEQAEDGAKICMQNRASPEEGNCRTLGNCHITTNTGCVVEEPVERARVYPGCGTISDCNPNSSPIISRSEADARCNTFGRCEALGGPCSVSVMCAGFESAQGIEQQVFCESSEISCLISFDATFIQSATEASCLTHCATGGKSCLTAYSSNGGCDKGDPIPCSESRGRVICECE